MKIAVVGNCQSLGLARCLSVMAPDLEVVTIHLGIHASEDAQSCDVIAIQSEFARDVSADGRFAKLSGKTVLPWPTFYFPAFHPDLVYVHGGHAMVQSPVGDYHSSLALFGWQAGLGVERTQALFCDDVFQQLGFLDYWATSESVLRAELLRCGIDDDAAMRTWRASGCFAHTINHPKLIVLSTFASAILKKLGIAPTTEVPENYTVDPLLHSPVWPVYPPIAKRLGISGDYFFKGTGDVGAGPARTPMLGLPDFVQASFSKYEALGGAPYACERLIAQADLYRTVADRFSTRSRRSNPYAALPDHQFWKRGVAQPAMGDVDPVVRTKFKLRSTDRIATAGSCFAQHIARTLVSNGYNHFIAEPPPIGMEPSRATELGYGLFSARFGNVYTARQLVQLFDRAYGRFVPQDAAWQRPDGRWIDPFRPQAEPDGFDTAAAVVAAREPHLARVRRMFEDLDLFVFTIGLTEAWRAVADGAVFPVAPGVVSAVDEPSRYSFVNLTAAEVAADLRGFTERLASVNRKARILLTVSPVPLVATYEDRHVLVSTTYSKSALRVAAEETVLRFENVDYFPSFEVIMGTYNRGRYFADDLREVRLEGVAHVMRLFRRHLFSDAASQADAPDVPAPRDRADAWLRAEIGRGAQIVCDEELLDRAAV